MRQQRLIAAGAAPVLDSLRYASHSTVSCGELRVNRAAIVPGRALTSQEGLMIGEQGDAIIFQSSPARSRPGVIAGNVTDTHADLVVFSDGYGWEHGADAGMPCIFLPQVPFGDQPWQWQLKPGPSPVTQSAAVITKAGAAMPAEPEISPIAVYYSRF